MPKAIESSASRIHHLADQILHHKQVYYGGVPEISDAEFDRLEDELRRLAPDHPVLSFVGAQKFSSAPKIEHSRPMLSLDKTYVEADLISWCGGRPVVGTVKVDGNSISLIYRGGKLSVAKTRGNGRIGEDVLTKIRWIPDIPVSLPDLKGEIEIRGELYCSEPQFLRLVHEMDRQGLEKPTNPRNIVAGVLGRTTFVENARFFNFFAFEAISDGRQTQFRTEMEKFEWLEKNGFQLPFHRHLNDADQIRAFLKRVQIMMNEDEIGIDGAVFSYNDLRLHEELGDTSHHPRYKLAFKWQGQTANSKIREIAWDTSRLGIVTPVAIIEPVHLSGAKITNVTLHNAAIVKNFDLKAGDEIEVVRSGEVIPKFLRVIQPAKGAAILPAHCPSCASELAFDDVRLLCRNKEKCPAQVSRSILNWIRCVEIDDLSEKRLEQMLLMGLVRTIADLYRLSLADLLTLPLTKEKMAQKILDHIEKSRRVPLANFLNGLGIEGTGQTSWEKILENFPSLERVCAATANDIQMIEGFADRSAQQIVEGLETKRKLIDELLQVGVDPIAPTPARAASGPLVGMTVVITGALSQPRAEVERLIKSAGGRLGSSVSKTTSVLVTNESDSGSSKMKKAKELGVQIWDETKLMEMLK